MFNEKWIGGDEPARPSLELLHEMEVLESLCDGLLGVIGPHSRCSDRPDCWAFCIDFETCYRQAPARTPEDLARAALDWLDQCQREIDQARGRIEPHLEAMQEGGAR